MRGGKTFFLTRRPLPVPYNEAGLYGGGGSGGGVAGTTAATA